MGQLAVRVNSMRSIPQSLHGSTSAQQQLECLWIAAGTWKPLQRGETFKDGSLHHPLHLPCLSQVKCHACVGGTSVREDARILGAGEHKS
jgi:hypothetical protein